MSDGDQGVPATTEEDVPPVRVPVYDDRGRIIGRISVLVPRMASDLPAATGALENVVRDLLARSYFAGKGHGAVVYDMAISEHSLPPSEAASRISHDIAAARAYSGAVFNVTMTKIAHAMPELVPRSGLDIVKAERDSAVEQLGEYRARDQAIDRPAKVKHLVGLYNFSGGYKAFAHDINEAYRQDKEIRRGLAAFICGFETWADFVASISDDTTREQAATIDALRAQVAAIAEERDDLMKRCDANASDLATLRELNSGQAQTIKDMVDQTDELRARLEDEPVEVNAVEEDGEALLRRVMLGVINDIRADPITRVNVAQEYAKLGPVRKQQPVVQNDGFFSVTSAEQLYPMTTTANTNGGVARRPRVGFPKLNESQWPAPTAAMLEDPLFNAVWDVIKKWDIGAPGVYDGYCGATGNHARAIVDRIARLVIGRPAPMPNSPTSDVFTSSAPGPGDFPKSAAAYFTPVHSGTSVALTEGQAAAQELAATVPTDTRAMCPKCGSPDVTRGVMDGSRNCARCGYDLT